ncbi:LytR C-terminal domain-containing protein [Streptomyces sp. FXJ1.172]|uniref:LytR C-terminal domain-containing protein n=1 Tax=Streptomyces sp. FXJ1.172 TaxID=710705 RepID=UPI002F42DF32
MLSGLGFTVTGIGKVGEDRPVTLVRYGPGHQAEAETVARLFPGTQSQPTADPGVTVILGWTNTTPPTQPPTPGPGLGSKADGTRSADDDPCSDLSYGRPPHSQRPLTQMHPKKGCISCAIMKPLQNEPMGRAGTCEASPRRSICWKNWRQHAPYPARTTRSGTPTCP